MSDYCHLFEKIFIDEAHHINKPEIYQDMDEDIKDEDDKYDENIKDDNNDDEDILNKIHGKYEEMEKLRLLYNDISPFTKRILYLKYNFYQDKILSNKHVAILMCCSEETIRIHLLEVKEKINIFSQLLY